jgi:hypothetical protein
MQTILAQQLVIGQSVDVVQGWRLLGVNPTTGLFEFQGGDHPDKTVIGHLDANGFGGISSSLRYRGFQMEGLLDARIIKGINYLIAVYANNPPGSYFSPTSSNAPLELTRRWQNPGDIARYQKATTDPASKEINYFLGSDRQMTNASFLRLKKLIVSCQIPVTITGLPRLTKVTVFLIGQNLFTITPYKDVDPEIQSPYILPPLRIVEGGIRLGL